MFKRVASSFRIGVSRIGCGDGIADGEFVRSLENVFNLPDYRSSTKRHTIMDVDHVYGRWADHRDYFLTRDTGILGNRDNLGIDVLTPEKFMGKYDRGELPRSDEV